MKKIFMNSKRSSHKGKNIINPRYNPQKNIHKLRKNNPQTTTLPNMNSGDLFSSYPKIMKTDPEFNVPCIEL